MKLALALCTMILPVLPYGEQVDVDPTGDVLTYEGHSAKVVTTLFRRYLESHPGARTDSDIVMAHEVNYSACWEFVDSQLCLTNAWILRSIQDSFELMVEVMPELFPGQKRVLADWFTGYLVIPHGPHDFLCPTDCALAAEHYTMFTVVDGMLAERWSMTGSSFCEFQESQFRAYQQSEEYLRLFTDELARNSQHQAQRNPGHPRPPRFDSSQAESVLQNRARGRYLSIIRDTAAVTR